MEIRRALGPDYNESSKEGVMAFVGKERYEKYKEIFPLLVLLQYRANHETDIVDVMQRVSWGDMLIRYHAPRWKAVMHVVGAFILYIYLWIMTIRGKRSSDKNGETAIFSNTFVNSRRYPVARKQFSEFYGFQTITAVCDALQMGEGSIKKSLLRSLQGNYGTYRPVFFRGVTIEGRKLKKAAMEWCRLFIEYQAGEQIDRARMDRLLETLQREYIKRKKMLKGALENKHIEAYITVNQYNLRDVLIIHACYEIGIRTIQLEHHAAQFSRINYSEEQKMLRYAFAQEFCLWNESERLFHKKIFKYENILGNDDELEFRIVGNIEMTYEQACEITKKCKAERRITFMTSALEDEDLDTAEQVIMIKKWRWEIFHGLKTLMKRQNVMVRIRYTPFAEMQFRSEEIPILKQWGFEISESVPENLIEDMCCSMAIMSTTSTVLSTARALGRMTFRIEDPAVDYIKADPGLIDICLKNIPEIIFPPVESIGKLNPKDFFLASRLLQKTDIEE